MPPSPYSRLGIPSMKRLVSIRLPQGGYNICHPYEYIIVEKEPRRDECKGGWGALVF